MKIIINLYRYKESTPDLAIGPFDNEQQAWLFLQDFNLDEKEFIFTPFIPPDEYLPQ